MAFKREEVTTEQITAFLEDAVSKVKSNPEEYEELKKVFKKNVPLTLRNFVAAYVLKQASGAVYRFNNYKNREEFGHRRFERNNDSSDGYENREPREKHERYQHINIDPEVAATVFVGVGRNRRVFPRDIVGLFISVAGIEKERIGDIKVLANYSFVQLFKEDADKAIAALNGYDYRGRKLSVSFSRQRDDEIEADESFDDNDEVVENTSSIETPKVVEKTAEVEKTVVQKSYAEMTDEEIMAMRAPKSSSTSDIQ